MRELLRSKKFISSVLASVVALAAMLNDVPPEQIAAIIAPLMGYTLSQGLADQGKEKARLEREGSE